MSYKNKDSYKTISEVVEILNKNNLKNYENHTHTIRYWETQFKQIKPKKINNRRYYNTNDKYSIKNTIFTKRSRYDY